MLEDEKRRKTATVVRTQMLTSTCRIQYNLAAFPFDHQELRVVLFILPQAGLQWEIKLGELMPAAVAALETSWKDPDWALIPGSFYLERERHSIYGDRILVNIKVRRLYAWYLWNFFLIIFLVTTLAFSGFVWNEEEEREENYDKMNVVVSSRNPYDSISISLLALLTIVSFKSYMGGHFLPRVAYMTMLDIYTMVSLTTCMATILLHCLRIYFRFTHRTEISLASGLYFAYLCGFHGMFAHKALVYIREARSQKHPRLTLGALREQLTLDGLRTGVNSLLRKTWTSCSICNIPGTSGSRLTEEDIVGDRRIVGKDRREQSGDSILVETDIQGGSNACTSPPVGGRKKRRSMPWGTHASWVSAHDRPSASFRNGVLPVLIDGVEQDARNGMLTGEEGGANCKDQVKRLRSNCFRSGHHKHKEDKLLRNHAGHEHDDNGALTSGKMNKQADKKKSKKCWGYHGSSRDKSTAFCEVDARGLST
ncbi:unnamed protein product [Amoebophrya sp. A25]|nr:unnamed protein product [Amoebophrya sp. A25]|eukprot:GSA25T00008764001.1